MLIIFFVICCLSCRFPLKDSKRLMQWLKAVQRDNWTPTKYSFLCSEHFTKDSFSKRLEDQHRLLKPTAVPSIFHLAEKKRGAGGHGRPRRRDTGKASAGLRAQASDPVDGKAAAGSPSSSSASPMAKPEPRKLKRATPQGRTAARAARETAGQERGRQPLEGRAEDGPASAATSCSQGEAGTGAEDAGEEGATPADSGLVDRSGVSADDFTPPGSGACKFIGSLHSYSFSSKHARERPAVPREPVERKRLRRDAEPGIHRWPKALEKLACSQRTLQELQRGCQDCFAALSGPIIGEEGRLMWISFIKLLRAILKNVHLVPPGPAPSLASCPLLGACVWESLGSGHKSLGFTHSQNSLLP